LYGPRLATQEGYKEDTSWLLPGCQRLGAKIQKGQFRPGQGGKNVCKNGIILFFCPLRGPCEPCDTGILHRKERYEPQWSQRTTKATIVCLDYIDAKKILSYFGSRRKFVDGKNNIISLHKPHPANILKHYQTRDIITHLKEKGKIQK
jgi:hypothetical protein